MFTADLDTGALTIERAAFWRVERCGDPVTRAGDLVHFETSTVHRIWRLTGEIGLFGNLLSYRGVWPD